MQVRWRNNLIRIKTLLRSIIMGLNGSLKGICQGDWYVGKKIVYLDQATCFFDKHIGQNFFFLKYRFLCDENINLVFFMYFILTLSHVKFISCYRFLYYICYSVSNYNCLQVWLPTCLTFTAMVNFLILHLLLCVFKQYSITLICVFKMATLLSSFSFQQWRLDLSVQQFCVCYFNLNFCVLLI